MTHPRIVINEVCSPALPLADQITWWQRAGATSVGLARFRRGHGDWQPDVTRIQDAGINIGYLMHAPMFRLAEPESWPIAVQALLDSIDVAAKLRIPTIYTTTGPRGRLSFEQAAVALAEAYAPVREHADKAGVRMLVETANPVFAHTHFLHSLADTVRVARRAGLGVCLDVHAIWAESALEAGVRDAGPLIGLVQVSDFVPGNLTVTRDVIGEGVIPIEDMLRTTLDTGYQGLFDLELFARPAATALADTRASIERLGEILDRLGA
jgi:sugar phosphate isomerase/epimerase